jgi:hypothetical protein
MRLKATENFTRLHFAVKQSHIRQTSPAIEKGVVA